MDVVTREASTSLRYVEVPIQGISVCRRVEPTMSDMNICVGGELGKVVRQPATRINSYTVQHEPQNATPSVAAVARCRAGLVPK
jgi:hypothetical protein